MDATNVVEKPSVCGISSLGMDHVDILGDTLEKIATEKAGIMKPGRPVLVAINANRLRCMRQVEHVPSMEVLHALLLNGKGGGRQTVSASKGGILQHHTARAIACAFRP